ncbi:hypothetical protein SLEP1_g53270 [Rubroshorea leprosula]|nr:hypothetical protein SLEP1_g53270 [Rubroshorea leprosula]
MVRIFTGGCPPRNEMDEQEDVQLSELGLNDFRPMPRNLFVGGAEQDHLSETDDDERTPTGYATQPKPFQGPTGTRQRHSRPYNSQHERPERSTEPARTTELKERTRVLKMAMGMHKVVATRNSSALSNVVVPTKPRGSGRLNNEPSSSKHSEELIRKNVDLERQLRDVQKSIDELKSPRSHQQTLDLDSAPLNLSITAEPYQEGFKIPHLETYDGSGDPDEHLHTYQAIMRIQNANDAMMCKFLDDLSENPPKTWNEVNDRSASFILSEDFQSSKRGADDKQSKGNEQLPRREEKKKQKLNEPWGKPAEFPKYANYIPLTLPRSQILAQIQHWIRRPPPPLHDSPRVDKRYVQKPHTQQPPQTHFVQGYDRPQGQRYQLGNAQDVYYDNPYPSEQGKANRGRQFNRRGQG